MAGNTAATSNKQQLISAGYPEEQATFLAGLHYTPDMLVATNDPNFVTSPQWTRQRDKIIQLAAQREQYRTGQPVDISSWRTQLDAMAQKMAGMGIPQNRIVESLKPGLAPTAGGLTPFNPTAIQPYFKLDDQASEKGEGITLNADGSLGSFQKTMGSWWTDWGRWAATNAAIMWGTGALGAAFAPGYAVAAGSAVPAGATATTAGGLATTGTAATTTGTTAGQVAGVTGEQAFPGMFAGDTLGTLGTVGTGQTGILGTGMTATQLGEYAGTAATAATTADSLMPGGGGTSTETPTTTTTNTPTTPNDPLNGGIDVSGVQDYFATPEGQSQLSNFFSTGTGKTIWDSIKAFGGSLIDWAKANPALASQLVSGAAGVFGAYKAGQAMSNPPDWQNVKTPTEYYNDPFTQASLAQITKQVQSTNAAKGLLNSGRTMQDVADAAYTRQLLPFMQTKTSENIAQNNFNLGAWQTKATGQANAWTSGSNAVGQTADSIGGLAFMTPYLEAFRNWQNSQPKPAAT